MGRRDAKLGKLLVETRDKIAPLAYQQQDPKTGKFTSWSYGQVYVERVWQKAVDGNEWAMQFVAERTEGKPVNGSPIDEADAVEERLDELTTKQLNQLSERLGQQVQSPDSAARGHEQAAADIEPITPTAIDLPAGSPAAKLLALRGNRAGGPKDHNGEPALPAAGEGAGAPKRQLRSAD